MVESIRRSRSFTRLDPASLPTPLKARSASMSMPGVSRENNRFPAAKPPGIVKPMSTNRVQLAEMNTRLSQVHTDAWIELAQQTQLNLVNRLLSKSPGTSGVEAMLIRDLKEHFGDLIPEDFEHSGVRAKFDLLEPELQKDHPVYVVSAIKRILAHCVTPEHVLIRFRAAEDAVPLPSGLGHGRLPWNEALRLNSSFVFKQYVKTDAWTERMNRLDQFGLNGLTVAVMMDRGGVAAPQALIEKGLDPLRPNADGSTPLQWAAYCGNAELVQWTLGHLSEKGVHIREEAEYIALAEQRRQVLERFTGMFRPTDLFKEKLKDLLTLRSFNADGDDAPMPIDDTTAVQDLQDAPAEPPSTEAKNLLFADLLKLATLGTRATRFGASGLGYFLHNAAKKKNGAAEIALLVELGAHIGTPSTPHEGGYSVLHSAMNHPENFKALLDAGVDVDQKDSVGKTIIQCAAAYGRTDLVKMLLARGASIVETQDHSDHYLSPLSSAIMSNHQDIVLMMLAAGAEKNHVGLDGKTAWHHLAHKGDEDLIKILDLPKFSSGRKDRQGDSPIQYAAAAGNIVTARAMLDDGAPIDATGHDGKPAVYRACEFGKMDMVIFLASRGAKLTHVDERGRTILHLCAEKSSTDDEQDKALLGFCPKGLLDQKDERGNTPLHTAGKNRNETLFELLKQQGADPMITNDKGKVPELKKRRERSYSFDSLTSFGGWSDAASDDD